MQCYKAVGSSSSKENKKYIIARERRAHLQRGNWIQEEDVALLLLVLGLLLLRPEHIYVHDHVSHLGKVSSLGVPETQIAK